MWDGPQMEPIVYHGYTLTSKIQFRDVLRVIKSHGFVASPYPIILSFENHCSKPVQDKMAQYIIEILGDLVLTYKDNGKKLLPSPEELRGRVLIKGSSHVTAELELFEEIDEIDTELNSVLGGGTMSHEELAFVTEKLATVRGRGNAEQEKIESDLNALIYLKTKKLAKFPTGYESFSPNNMTSFSENRVNRILQPESGFQNLRLFNSRHISRVYPKGTRFDSSNYDPIVLW